MLPVYCVGLAVKLAQLPWLMGCAPLMPGSRVSAAPASVVTPLVATIQEHHSIHPKVWMLLSAFLPSKESVELSQQGGIAMP